MLRKFKATKDSNLYEEYKKQKNFVVNLIRRTKAEYYEHLIEENKVNPKGLWTTLKKILPGKKSSLPK